MATHIPYKNTGYFSKLVTDYIAEADAVKNLYHFAPHLTKVQDAIEARTHFPDFRNKLVLALEQQYQGLKIHEQVANNINLLKAANTFTITTAHQPNIFTGPLYFVYKILHAVKIANELNDKFSDKHFVPVYYMGSEDADLQELNHILIQGKKYVWHTTQTGAVGRMQVDDTLLKLIDEMRAQLGVYPFGDEWITFLKDAYKKGHTIQQATLHLINHLFGRLGLIVFIPDNRELKKLFAPIVEKELLEQFSQKQVAETAQEINKKGYKVQTGGRNINLFYLKDHIRERIEISGDKYHVVNTQLSFTKEEILTELEQHPERFSGNVILRGVFQETVLPNIIFIGGGGELAYWLELKGVFKKVGVPYPMLVLRNSFLLVNKEQQATVNNLGIDIAQLFNNTTLILDKINASNLQHISISLQMEEIAALYDSISQHSAQADTTLLQHALALKTIATKRLHSLQKKMDRAQRKKLHNEQKKISTLKDALFPAGNLQERKEHCGYYYAKYGNEIFDILLKNSLTFEQAFSIISV